MDGGQLNVCINSKIYLLQVEDNFVLENVDHDGEIDENEGREVDVGMQEESIKVLFMQYLDH